SLAVRKRRRRYALPAQSKTSRNGRRFMGNALTIAARVIGRSSRELPADAALRDEFRKQPGLSRALSGDISRAVFAYFRWRGWLDPGKSMAEQIAAAEEL